MRVPRVRLRTLMIAVAVVGIVLWVEALMRRRAYFLVRVEVHASRADDFAKGYVCLREEYDRPGMYERFRDHEAALAKKYRRLALYPWLPVPPDPPAPE